MKDTLTGVELAAQWRDGGQQGNPAGPLFTSEFAEADITAECMPGTKTNCGTDCTGSITKSCC